jgi:hypothetical protein
LPIATNRNIMDRPLHLLIASMRSTWHWTRSGDVHRYPGVGGVDVLVDVMSRGEPDDLPGLLPATGSWTPTGGNQDFLAAMYFYSLIAVFKGLQMDTVNVVRALIVTERGSTRDAVS